MADWPECTVTQTHTYFAMEDPCRAFITVSATERGNPCLIVDNYRFCLRRQGSGAGILRWKCSASHCYVAFITDESYNFIKWGGTTQHVMGTAAPDGSRRSHRMSDAVAMRQLVRASAKRKALDNLNMLPSKVIIDALMEVDTGPEEHLVDHDLTLCTRAIERVRSVKKKRRQSSVANTPPPSSSSSSSSSPTLLDPIRLTYPQTWSSSPLSQTPYNFHHEAASVQTPNNFHHEAASVQTPYNFHHEASSIGTPYTFHHDVAPMAASTGVPMCFTFHPQTWPSSPLTQTCDIQTYK
ncbi:uncharacterized protein LOC117646563 [Thrips palmi]|uniref:Uncharacterized protein LOC117646563 n=1 Tax=Thrips palmi TaxID=161013 RepID=A0A6P8ZP51_THRPL|nr:uncharacterized protein LOC117646563 [Thrips palmi]